MIQEIMLNNFGPIDHALRWENLGSINLIIGSNGSGKTTILKAVYCAIKTIEAYKRGDNPKNDAEIIYEKLYWTFQADKVGDIVTKGADSPLSFAMRFNDSTFAYEFGKDTTKQIVIKQNTTQPRNSNSIFIPAKEVLSVDKHILRSRETEESFGFDDTYLDLARALRKTTTKGKNYSEFALARKNLEEILGGHIEFDEVTNRWYFKDGNQKFPIGMTAEGVKKIAIMDTLLGNRYLDKDSVIFFDEPESALHPHAIGQLLNILCMLAESGIQVFLATHSYFVIKKLFLLAQQHAMSIPALSEEDGQWLQYDALHGLPDNAIIRESIQLYEEEVGLAFT